MNGIKINDKTVIDLPKLIESRLLIQANSGGGKSWLIRRILEQSHDKVQQIILDPEGEFSTLREKHDYILAGKGGDTPAEPRSAALLARRLLELKVSAIIDLYELPPQERKRFVRLFLEAMVNAPKELYHDVLVVLDEAHMFVPQVGESEAASAVIDLATRGRKRGFCAILATQRISKLHKDAAAECNNKLIGRTSQDIDMARAADELGFVSKDQKHSLRTLKPGDFFAFGPAISDEVQQIKVGPVSTAHPNVGALAASHSVPPTEAIKRILGKLADLPQEAAEEARNVADLRKENAQLKRSLAMKVAPTGPTTKIERIEVPTVGKRALEGIKKAEASMRRMLKAMKEGLPVVEAGLDKLSAEISRVGSPVPPQAIPPLNRVVVTLKATAAIPAHAGIDGLTGPEQRILDAIAWLESIGVPQPEQTAVAFLAGYTYGGGGFNNPKGALRTKGLVEYVPGSKIMLTEEGRSIANVPVQVLTAEELHAKVLSALEAPQRRILKPLLERYPEAIGGEELAELSGYKFGTGGFNNPKGRLRSLGLIEYQPGGMVRARDILFV